MRTIQLLLKVPTHYPYQYALGIILNIIAIHGNPKWTMNKPMDIEVDYEADYQTEIEEGYFYVIVDYILGESYDIDSIDWDEIFDAIEEYIEHTKITWLASATK